MEDFNEKNHSCGADLGQKLPLSFGKSITIKAIVIVGLMIVLLLPVALVGELVDNRQRSSQDISTEITSQWGEQLELGTPCILNGVLNEIGQYEPTSALFADSLSLNSDINVQELHRGIYKTQVYSTTITADFNFLDDVLKSWMKSNPEQWNFIYVFIPINNNTIQGDVSVTLNGKNLEISSYYYNYRPSLSSNILGNGIRAKIYSDDILNVDDLNFKVAFGVTGSQQLSFSSIARNASIKVSSAWNSPSFYGNPLPVIREVTNSGFTAQWSVVNISGVSNTSAKIFGVKLVSPVNHYLQVERSIKYAYMFIALTFLAFFLVEITCKTRIHPIQYFLVSAALILFYTLLLSLSEHINFSASYFVSMAATVSLITCYTHTILRKWSLTWAMCAWFVILYLFLFVMLQMEDYALLVGSLGLFTALGATMYILRNVKWYDK